VHGWVQFSVRYPPLRAYYNFNSTGSFCLSRCIPCMYAGSVCLSTCNECMYACKSCLYIKMGIHAHTIHAWKGWEGGGMESKMHLRSSAIQLLCLASKASKLVYSRAWKLVVLPYCIAASLHAQGMQASVCCDRVEGSSMCCGRAWLGRSALVL
jgi:hypothetical protein